MKNILPSPVVRTGQRMPGRHRRRGPDDGIDRGNGDIRNETLPASCRAAG